jgi:HD-GYP domain-containing protein (c-di-GMP phosphodiesterase class II)
MRAEERLKLIPLDLLHEGMVLSGDIHSFNLSSRLAVSGMKVDADFLEKIIRLNRRQKFAYVSAEMAEELERISDKRRHAVTVNDKLERETGYTEISEGTKDIIRQVAAAEKPSEEMVYTVSSEIAQRLKIIEPSVIFDLINALAPADEYLQRHVVNVSMLNGLLGRWLGLPERETDMMVLVGLIHDCGKALIPQAILNAPRKLTIAEFEVMKTHTLYSFKLLDELPDYARSGALYHHEKIDGSGYPKNLRGSAVPLSARITSISDIYDAMVSRRAYKNPVSPFSVLANLSRMKDSALDPDLVDVFVGSMPGELIGKAVLLSDQTVGTVHSVDIHDVEHPNVLIGGKVIKTDGNLHCTAMLCP